MASFDFPGAILLAYLALLTGLGSFFYAGLSALAGYAMARAGRLLDAWGGWLVLAVWTVAPMVWTLSLTEHAQLVSRCLICGAWACYLRELQEKCPGRSVNAALLGLAAALAFLTRPAETAMVLGPVGCHLLWRAWQQRTTNPQAWRIPWVAGLVAMMGPALHLAYGQVMFGSPWRQPRFLIGAGESSPIGESLFARLGENAGFNWMMLLLFFVGPILLPLIAAALATGRTEAKVALAALLAHFALALAHDNTGLHLVGPIHYAEAVAPLLVLLVLGARPLADRLAQLLGPRPYLLAPAVAYWFALAIFGGVHGGTLAGQAAINRAPLEITAELPPAIVVADHYPKLWKMRGGDFWGIGSGVIEYPHPDPALQARVIFVNSRADLAALRRDFPERRLYRLIFAAEGAPLRLEAIP